MNELSTCAECIYWDPVADLPEGNGLCCYSSPKVVVQNDVLVTVFPVTQSNRGCGDGFSREALEAKKREFDFARGMDS